MATATYDGVLRRSDDAGERLRLEKLEGPKGAWILIATLLSFPLVVMPITFWMASHIAPEGEHSEGFVHEPLDRPADMIGDPRTIGE